MVNPERIGCVLFDLDGTLVDTAPDMVGALDELRAEEGLAPEDYQSMSRHVSRGALGLLSAGLPPRDEAAMAAAVARFLELYAARVSRSSRLFPGLDLILERIERRGWAWGVVTNKPGWLSEPLLADLGLSRRIAALVCGDTLDKKKPDPAPLLHACELAGVKPAAAVYIGDDERDIVAGRAAGLATVAAGYGYVFPGENPRSWRADAIVDSVAGIGAVLGLDGAGPA